MAQVRYDVRGAGAVDEGCMRRMHTPATDDPAAAAAAATLLYPPPPRMHRQPHTSDPCVRIRVEIVRRTGESVGVCGTADAKQCICDSDLIVHGRVLLVFFAAHACR
jgi:hypothetical protein